MTTWIKELLKNLDAYVDESTKEKILGACGKKCPFTHLTDERLLKIKKSFKNDIDFLSNLCDQWRMVKEDEQFYVVFDQCYCPMVSQDTQGASKTLCYCTLGNLMHKFSIGLDIGSTLSDGYSYVDRYYGFNPFSGTEHIYTGDEALIWKMVYYLYYHGGRM